MRTSSYPYHRLKGRGHRRYFQKCIFEFIWMFWWFCKIRLKSWLEGQGHDETKCGQKRRKHPRRLHVEFCLDSNSIVVWSRKLWTYGSGLVFCFQYCDADWMCIQTLTLNFCCSLQLFFLSWLVFLYAGKPCGFSSAFLLCRRFIGASWCIDVGQNQRSHETVCFVRIYIVRPKSCTVLFSQWFCQTEFCFDIFLYKNN